MKFCRITGSINVTDKAELFVKPKKLKQILHPISFILNDIRLVNHKICKKKVKHILISARYADPYNYLFTAVAPLLLYGLKND